MKRENRPGRIALAVTLGLGLWVAAPAQSPATLILDNSRDVYLDLQSPALLHAPLPAVSDACESPAEQGRARTASLGRPDPALPPATSLAPDDGSLSSIAGRSLGIQTANGANAGNGKTSSSRPDVLGQIRHRISLIESCRLHVEQLLSALRAGLLKGLERQSSSLPVVYTSRDNNTTKHNFPDSRIKTVKVRYVPTPGGAAKKASGKEEPKHQGWGFSRLSITITGFLFELFSYAYTYVFIVIFGAFTLYFRYYMNRS